MGVTDWMERGGLGRITLVAVLGAIALALAIILPVNFIRAGVITEFEGTVQMVNRNNFIMPKTYVVLQTYAGDNDEFTLAGYHDFEVDQQYRIKYVNRLYVGGLWLLGDLQEVEIKS